ncbi:MAG: hybrid sensor histidine kinase/response regulator [Aggregatilineales bacterium]
MKRILVIEDEYSLRRDIMEMLAFEGYEVDGAENGAAGIAQAQRQLPDLIICDIMMPEIDGYGVLDALRRNEATAAIPFIFLTARTDKVDQRHGMEQGADDYLTKPFTVQELLKSVDTRLRRHRDIEQVSERRLENLRDSIILAMPHELRTPLTVIMGFSDLLKADCETISPDRVHEMAEHISQAASRLYHMIENYLVYAQTEIIVADPNSKDLLRSHETLEPRIVVEDQAIQRAQFYNRESDLSLEVQDAPGVRILEDYLKKAVSEIVDNAFKFSAPETPVCVSATVEQGAFYTIKVRNRGRGMTAEQIAQVGAYMQFNRRFYEQQGSGLGLIIARRLAELHGGQLEIESAVDADTTVTLTLPLT